MKFSARVLISVNYHTDFKLTFPNEIDAELMELRNLNTLEVTIDNFVAARKHARLFRRCYFDNRSHNG